MADCKAYTYQALAERWACSVDLIYKMVRRGEIKTFRIGRATRINNLPNIAKKTALAQGALHAE